MKIDLLKIRYSYLKLYLCLLEYISNNKYIYKIKDISKYLFINCSLFNLARSKLKNKLVTNYLLFLFLLNISFEIEVNIVYLNKINIYTRKYHLVRKLVDN
ncbi:hypothetical protein CJF30_00003010 [Rutstroemia sp. NJR-2017a BBW]|nr:hypothetical protein CJF30_00003010 [Rutstroemia sp. NJR-2017a BBW]